MKHNENIENIHIAEKRHIPKYFHEEKEELLSDKHKDEETVSIGKNRNQLFIRLPARMVRMLSLTTEDNIKITTEMSEKGADIKLEIIKGDQDASRSKT